MNEGIGAASLDQAVAATQQERESEDLHKAPEAQFHCSVCQAVSPAGAPHRCNLTGRAKARADRAQAELAAFRAKERQPRECPDCKATTYPTVPHACPGRPADRHVPGPLTQIVEGLKAAGYKITKESN